MLSDMDTTTATTPSPTTATDPRPLFASAARVATSTIRAVDDDQRDRRTPCRAFDVADLLDHLAVVGPRVAALGRGEADYRVQTAGTQTMPVAGVLGLWVSAIADAEAAWDDPASLGRSLTLPWATLPGAAVLTMYVSEVTVHTWDLARATGQQPEWDPAVLEASLAFMKDALPADIRGDAGDEQVPFAPVIATPTGASMIDQLVAWTGRDPAWT
jgi:uncharacterized protein (TIGR03086 family)